MKTVMPIFSHCVAMLLIGFSCIAFDSHADNGLVPFSFANPQVNHALIRLYEQQTSIWQKDQLYLVGLCYIAEKELDKAQELFEKLRDQGSTNINVLQTLGSLYHMKGKSTEAAKLYQQVWHQSKDVDALRQLAVLKLQVKDIEGLKPLINDLLAHQTDRMDIQMVLLSYSLIIDDMETGGRIYEAVVHKLSKSRVEQNADLRKLLMFATLRYKDAAEAKEADRKSMDKDSGFTPLKATNRTTAAAVSLP